MLCEVANSVIISERLGHSFLSAVPGGTSWLAARYFLSDCRLA